MCYIYRVACSDVKVGEILTQNQSHLTPQQAVAVSSAHFKWASRSSRVLYSKPPAVNDFSAVWNLQTYSASWEPDQSFQKWIQHFFRTKCFWVVTYKEQQNNCITVQNESQDANCPRHNIQQKAYAFYVRFQEDYKPQTCQFKVLWKFLTPQQLECFFFIFFFIMVTTVNPLFTMQILSIYLSYLFFIHFIQ